MYYQVEEQDGYYRIGSPENVFCYLFVGSKQAALIDTGYGFGNLEQTVRSVTDKPVVIINTHDTAITPEEMHNLKRCVISVKKILRFVRNIQRRRCEEIMQNVRKIV